jgi:hypothetical protein
VSDVIRSGIGVAGLAAGGYGGWLLLDRQDTAEIVDAGLWLVAGVLLHDVGVTAVVLLAALAVGLLPRTTRAPAAVALVVVGALTLAAIPVLGRYGERADNPTHLDRPYLAGWLALVALSIVAVAIAGVVRARRQED